MFLLRIYDRIQPVGPILEMPVITEIPATQEAPIDLEEKPSIWNRFQFQLIKKHLKEITIKEEPIQLTVAEKIIDVRKFIDTSLEEISNNWGKYYYEPSLLRIIKLHKILTDNGTSAD